MAVRGQYTPAEQRMLDATNKSLDQLVGWGPSMFSRFVSAESIKRAAMSQDPWNPLFRDESYATDTRWSGIIAPPFMEYFLSMSKGGHVTLEVTEDIGRQESLYIGENWQMYKPVRPGDWFKVWLRRPKLEDITSLDGKGPRRFALTAHNTDIINQKDELVSSFQLFLQFTFQTGPETRRIAMIDAKYAYSDKEMEYINQAIDNEQVRGRNIRWWEDVNTGDATNPVVLGPTTFSDQAVLSGGPGMLGHRKDQIKAMPWEFIYDPDTHMYYGSMEVHMNDRAAQLHGGMPRALHFGGAARNLMARLVTNWMGDDGFMRKFNWRHVSQSAVGDTLIGRGKVTNKRVENDEHLVDLKVWLEDIRGYVTEVASATVSLISKEKPYTWK